MDKENYGEIVICPGDGECSAYIFAGHNRMSFELESFDWRNDDDMKEYLTDTRCLTLNEIRDQIWAVHGRVLICVWVESPLSGQIYQVGNYNDDVWLLHGKTDGYA